MLIFLSLLTTLLLLFGMSFDSFFIFSTLKNYNEAGFKKAAVGMKVMTDSVAFDASFDAISKAYNAGLVYAVHHYHFFSFVV